MTQRIKFFIALVIFVMLGSSALFLDHEVNMSAPYHSGERVSGYQVPVYVDTPNMVIYTSDCVLANSLTSVGGRFGPRDIPYSRGYTYRCKGY